MVLMNALTSRGKTLPSACAAGIRTTVLFFGGDGGCARDSSVSFSNAEQL